MTAIGIDDLLLKTLAFLSFQISQVMRVIADLSPAGIAVDTLEMAFQYCSTVGRPELKSCTKEGQESQEAAARQIRLV